MSTALLIVGHGSREARANEAFEAMVAGYRAQSATAAAEVAHGYVELARPGVDEALAGLARRHRRVVVVPFFLFMVGHTKNDIPIALARARAVAAPGVELIAARELGVHGTLVDIAFERAAAAGLPDDSERARRTALVMVGRGSSDPDANAEFYRVARLMAEGRGLGWLWPCFIGITSPLVPETLEVAARARPERMVVVPYFLFDGRLGDRLRDEVGAFSRRHPWIRTTVAATLGPDPRLYRIIDERVQQALAGRAPLPCDTCQYRAPVSGVVGQVGGMRALLWSLRHGFTHSQAAPHRHAHRPLSRHVLVCGNVDCAGGGSVGLIEALRRLIKEAGRQDDIRITRTSCMGRCGEGPTVAVYPDGIWYRAVRPDDAGELVREHLLGDRLVARLVDDIMQ